MKKLQENAAVKFAVSLLMLVCFFLAGLAACRTIPNMAYVFEGDWRNVSRTYQVLYQRGNSVADYTALHHEMEELLLAMENGASVEYRLERTERQVGEAWAKLEAGQTCYRYRIFDAYGNPWGTNLEDWSTLEEEVPLVYTAYFYLGEHTLAEDQFDCMERWNSPVDIYESVQTPADDGSGVVVVSPSKVPLQLEYGIVREVPDGVSDEFTAIRADFEAANAAFPDQVRTAAVLLAAGLALMFFLLWASGHRAGAEGAVPSWQEEHIYFDIYLLAAGGAVFGLTAAGLWLGDLYLDNLYGRYGADSAGSFPFQLAEYGLAVLFTLAAGICVLVLRTFLVRLKTGTFVKTTLLCRVVGWMVLTIQRLFQGLGWLLANIPLFWKAALVCGAYMLSTFGFFLWRWFYFFPFVCLWCLVSLALLLLVCGWTIGFQQLRRGTRAIAAGELDRHIDTKNLLPDLRACAEDLNNISAGLNSAVEEKIKSERFKAELITNVSHDLKTPLTSIINYVDLLKTTEQTDPKAVEYIEVLDRKSQRLKKLTEDLVEASKASTGVLRVEREKIGMGQLIDQALGEWTEKLEAQRLSLVVSLPEGETWVCADGRHLWRVIDNLLSNCAKYAMEGTRVYVDLVRGKGQVALSVKNISRDPLNIPPDQLMERFVRGEESRTTEGSGLGLSIARSLTELQGGTFDLAVDGDLFKATVTLPQAG